MMNQAWAISISIWNHFKLQIIFELNDSIYLNCLCVLFFCSSVLDARAYVRRRSIFFQLKRIAHIICSINTELENNDLYIHTAMQRMICFYQFRDWLSIEHSWHSHAKMCVNQSHRLKTHSIMCFFFFKCEIMLCKICIYLSRLNYIFTTNIFSSFSFVKLCHICVNSHLIKMNSHLASLVYA